ncbi:MAG: hypothetical protein HC915_13400 [Anaerolineae bacterium]|nr:hypothetical protein [Anaerolineae bacterium]
MAKNPSPPPVSLPQLVRLLDRMPRALRIALATLQTVILIGLLGGLVNALLPTDFLIAPPMHRAFWASWWRWA